MKALSIKEPWAALIVAGKKTIETRTWRTAYRGPLLIVTSKVLDETAMRMFSGLNIPALPLGYAVAIANLIDCRPMQLEDDWAAQCPYHRQLYAWVLENIEPIAPFPVRGRLRLFDVDVESSQINRRGA